MCHKWIKHALTTIKDSDRLLEFFTMLLLTLFEAESPVLIVESW